MKTRAQALPRLLLVLLLLALVVPATLALAQGPPGNPPQPVIFTGPIQARPDGAVGEWRIADRDVVTTEATTFVPDAASLQVGDIVHVTAMLQDGQLLARVIRAVQQQPPVVTFRGVIQEIGDDQWVVDGRTVLITPDTVIEGDPPDVGDTAVVVAERRDVGLVARHIQVKDQFVQPEPVIFTGPIQERPDGAVGAWRIADRDVVTTEATTFVPDDASLQVGDTVHVTAMLQDGQLLARVIRAVEQQPPVVTFRGVIQEIGDEQWVVDGRTVLITPDTVIEGDPPDVGDTAVVVAERRDVGLVARHIQVKDQFVQPEPVIFTGPIQERPDGAVGAWRIADRDVVTTEATTFVPDDASLQVGDTVHVTAMLQDGQLLARVIRAVEQQPPVVTFRGVIQEIGDDQWVVDGRTVLITPDTVIEGDPPDVGDTAVVVAERRDVGLVAKRIQVKDQFIRPQPVAFRGQVQSITEDTWIVLAGEREVVVLVNASTRILGSPGVGDTVGVKGFAQPDETVLAYIIVKLQAPAVETPFAGFVTELLPTLPVEPPTWAWKVETPAFDDQEAASWVVIVTTETRINVDPFEVLVGAWVKGVGQKLADGAIAANTVRVTPPPRVRFGGLVTAVPAGYPDPVGAWTIGGFTVHVSAETEIDGDLPALGDVAGGFGELQADGSIAALLLKKLRPHP